MDKNVYLIYIDILGFEKLAVEISKLGIESREVRNRFIDIINDKLVTLEREKLIIGKNTGRDDWLLITDDINKVPIIVVKILEHHIPYKDYKEIPFEIAVGVGEYDKWATLSDNSIIAEDSTISFLKKNILKYYREVYKNLNKQSIKSSFIVFNKSAYDRLETFDKRKCKEIYKNNDIFYIGDIDKIKERGKVYEFLSKIGYDFSKRYDRIDEIYVPPIEYNDIKKNLKEKRIVFITGTPEYGKTFTALRLMWEYYIIGYEPKWIKGAERDQRIKVRERLEEIRAELKPKSIIYFEDPFGKTEYERRESIEREIGSIIDCINNYKDVYVIITSREEVFKEFKKEKISFNLLDVYENIISIKKPSYDYKKRKKILLNWANNENCKWYNNRMLRNLIITAIRDKKILPTPLSMHDFVIATKDINKEYKLRDILSKKSEETAKGFAKEIENMTDDKILFILILLVSDYFRVEFVKNVYEELVKELGIIDAYEFDRILGWFRNDKIDVSNNRLKISHPSYLQALEYLLLVNKYNTRINSLFSNVILKLSEKNEGTWAVAWIIAEYYDKLPENIKRLLFVYSKKDETIEEVVWAIAGNYCKLPKRVRRLLFKISENYKAAREVVLAIIEYYDELPKDDRDRLLLKLSENDDSVSDVAWILAGNYYKISKKVRNRLLLILAEKDEVSWDIALILEDKFNEIPKYIRNNMLMVLSYKKEVANIVVGIIDKKYEEIPEYYVKEVLLNLCLECGEKEIVEQFIKDNYERLAYEVRDLYDWLESI